MIISAGTHLGQAAGGVAVAHTSGLSHKALAGNTHHDVRLLLHVLVGAGVLGK